MYPKAPPAVDPAIVTDAGVTRDGQPLSYNRAPAADLAPWIARLYVTKAALPPDYTLACGLFNDVACVRIQLAGDWTAQTVTGEERSGRAALYFGPQSRHMPVSVRGSFVSLGIALRPGASTALRGPTVGLYLDRLADASVLGLPSTATLERFDPQASPECWLQVLEQILRERVEAAGWVEPDPVALRFEELCFRDPTVPVSQAASLCAVERRKLERVVRRDFGMAPRQVMRRARALDMASHLRGVADFEEREEIALRYYDESHLIHEFTELFGMSPRQFVRTPQPILTLTLESRQARRLEALNRIAPGESRPWTG